MAEQQQTNVGTLRVVAWPLFLIVLAVVMYLIWPRVPQDTMPSIVFVTADNTEYWDRVIEGAEAAARDYDAELTIVQPDGSIEDQNRSLADAMKSKPAGVAVSPVDAERQTTMLRQIAQSTELLTVDSDSEASDRICFVGTDNYRAGTVAGRIAKQLAPDGGRVLIVAGPLNKANGRERRQGVIDELLGREEIRNRPPDPIGEELSGDGLYLIRATIVDQLDAEESTRLVAEALAADSAVDVIVGLYGYHAAAIAEAVAQAGLGGEVAVVGFDSTPENTAAMNAGRVHGLVVQDQYQYGYESVRILAEVGRRAEYALPLSRTVIFPPEPMMAEAVTNEP